MSKQPRLRILLSVACGVVLFALAPLLQAQPRVLADEEMDQVCAKGSTGLSVDPAALNQMFFEISRQTSLGQVTGSGTVSVEVIPNPSGKTQVIVGAPSNIPSGTQAALGSSLATSLQVVNGTVRISSDVTIAMQMLPSALLALQQNRVVLPPGFNPVAGSLGLGGMH